MKFVFAVLLLIFAGVHVQSQSQNEITKADPGKWKTSKGQNLILPEIGESGNITAQVLQVVGDEQILIRLNEFIFSVKQKGIGKDKIDEQVVHLAILRTGTYKYTSPAGAKKSVPDCVIIDPKTFEIIK